MHVRLTLLLASLFIVHSLFASGDSWEDILKNGKGTVECYWFPNNVIVENSLDIIDGIEYELAVSFVKYLESKYQVEINLAWIEAESFDDVVNVVRYGTGGTFGASSISIMYWNVSPSSFLTSSHVIWKFSLNRYFFEFEFEIFYLIK